MNSQALMVQDNSAVAMPLMSIEQAMVRRQAIIDFTSALMKEGQDFGKIPGTQKNTLLKPGAEKLTTFFGLSPHFTIVDSVTDWMGDDHGGEPFFHFTYRCTLKRGDLTAGEGDGSCNSWEKKYRYRKGGRVCPHCGADTIIKGRAEYGGGWLCFAKKGGCGAKWLDGAQEIEGQQVGQVKNDNPADLVNTLQKMAQKRALVAATLIAVNASEFFTQDVEDYTNIIEADYTETKEEPKHGNGQRQGANGASVQKKAPPPKLQSFEVEGETLNAFEMELYRNDVGAFAKIHLHIKRYDHENAVKGALKKLGFDTWPIGDENGMLRVKMYRQSKEYAELRDDGVDSEAAVDYVKNVAKAQESEQVEKPTTPEQLSWDELADQDGAYSE